MVPFEIPSFLKESGSQQLRGALTNGLLNFTNLTKLHKPYRIVNRECFYRANAKISSPLSFPRSLSVCLSCAAKSTKTRAAVLDPSFRWEVPRRPWHHSCIWRAMQLLLEVACKDHSVYAEVILMATWQAAGGLVSCFLCRFTQFTMIPSRDLSNNSFTGSFPVGLSNLANLQFL